MNLFILMQFIFTACCIEVKINDLLNINDISRTRCFQVLLKMQKCRMTLDPNLLTVCLLVVGALITCDTLVTGLPQVGVAPMVTSSLQSLLRPEVKVLRCWIKVHLWYISNESL